MQFDLNTELAELSAMLDLSADQINPKKVQAKILNIQGEIEAEDAEVPASAFEQIRPEGRKMALSLFLGIAASAVES